MDNLSGQIGKLEEIDVLIKAQEKGANSGTEKVVLSDEILEYAKVALARVQEKLRMGEQIYERDLEFVEQVYAWMKLPEKLREMYPTIESMLKCEKESHKRAKDLAKIVCGDEYTDDFFEAAFFFDGVWTVVDEDLVVDETNEMIRFPEALLADSKIDVDSEGIVLPKILQIKEGVFFMIRSSFLVGSIKELQVESGAKLIIIGAKLENVDYEKGDQLIPEEAEIDGSIALVRMDVKNLPKRFMIGESIEFAYLKELELPNELIVGKDLMLTDTEISRWPELLVVNGNVYCSKEQRAKIHELMSEEKATLHGKCITDRKGNL